MADNRHSHTPPSDPDGEGVRIVPKPRTPRRRAALWTAVLVVLVATAVVWWVLAPAVTPRAAAIDADTVASMVDDGAARPEAAEAARASRRSMVVDAPPPPGHASDDLAAYFQPGDPEPTGAELIEALQHAGIRTGLGAFNPPGTSPPLDGLAVPDNFDLPEGYARHHQVTDAGVPIEPILMFAPGFTLYDAQGRRIPMPADRVVPPDLAPPGMPRRWVRVRGH